MRIKLALNSILFLFILLFTYTGISKLWDYEIFSKDIKQSPILKPVSDTIAWLIPCVELIIVLLLLNRRGRIVGLYISLALMLLFTGYLILLDYFTDYIPCSCGGILEKMPPIIHIIFNVCLSGMALTGIFLLRYKKMDMQGKQGIQTVIHSDAHRKHVAQ